jgi:hypothetical protein
MAWHTVVRRQVNASGVAHVAQVQLVQPSLVCVRHIPILEHVHHILNSTHEYLVQETTLHGVETCFPY